MQFARLIHGVPLEEITEEEALEDATNPAETVPSPQENLGDSETENEVVRNEFQQS
jgi:hypothetical protein